MACGVFVWKLEKSTARLWEACNYPMTIIIGVTPFMHFHQLISLTWSYYIGQDYSVEWFLIPTYPYHTYVMRMRIEWIPQCRTWRHPRIWDPFEIERISIHASWMLPEKPPTFKLSQCVNPMPHPAWRETLFSGLGAPYHTYIHTWTLQIQASCAWWFPLWRACLVRKEAA